MPDLYHKRLQDIRAILREYEADAFILSVNDEFFSEYPPEYFKRLHWLTGFDGSAGTVLIMAENAVFFTDGRYTLQTQQQLNNADYLILNSADVSPIQWLARNHPQIIIAVDPWLVSVAQYNKWQSSLPECNWVFPHTNPVDQLWQNRPALCQQPGFDYPVSYAGVSREEKLQLVANTIQQAKADAALLTLPESVCWLLNIRGHDVAHTPLLLCRALIYADSSYQLFAPSSKTPSSLSAYPHNIQSAFKTLTGLKLLYDPASTPLALAKQLEEYEVILIQAQDPCSLPKACKNPVELANITETHIVDGIALTRFLHWLDTNTTPITEISASDRLEAFRRESPDLLDLSFPSISGFGEHGAIVHYRATEETNRAFTGNTLYLIDSGGQYWGGTTDVTRTLAYGTPTEEMRHHYTLVLKGHIALAQAVFPTGTCGRQLDALARQFLWQHGLDYDHGTGHGVGCCLGVHEGPQRISKLGSDTPLAIGMILSNEPGYYKAGAYGIRIENLVVVEQAKDTPNYLCFRNLTCAPLDRKLVIAEMLIPAEIQWWNQYHAWVLASLVHKIPQECKEWLQTACKPLL